eukprot:358445-Chlamydomonas_euryale.AAC.37
MIDSRAAGGTAKRRRHPSGAPLLQTVGPLVHMGGLPTARRLADVLIHARQSAKRCKTQRRHAAGASSRERSAQAEATFRLKVQVEHAHEPCLAVVARCRAARRAGATSRVVFVSQGHKSKCHGALCVDQRSWRRHAASAARVRDL